jgi:hypothetical protein
MKAMSVFLIRRLRRGLKRIHAAIAAAKLHRLRNELMCRGGFVATPSIVPDARRMPQAPLILGEKWDF